MSCTCPPRGLDHECPNHGLHRSTTKKRKRQPGTSLPYKSEKQEILDAKWAGIKETFLFLMAKYDPDGPHCESCGVKGNDRTLDLHHLRRRSQGGSYAARNASLLCNRFNAHGEDNCHDRETGRPQWSGTRDHDDDERTAVL